VCRARGTSATRSTRLARARIRGELLEACASRVSMTSRSWVHALTPSGARVSGAASSSAVLPMSLQVSAFVTTQRCSQSRRRSPSGCGRGLELRVRSANCALASASPPPPSPAR
jgi:hypothetical protein